MSKAVKIWLIIAACLLVAGGVLFAVVMTVLDWDFTGLGSVSYETNRYEVSEPYTSVRIHTETADIRFVPAEGEGTAVVCYEQSHLRHRVWVEDGTLVIEQEDERAWYEHVSMGFDSPAVTVYLPGGAYGTLTVESDTGDVEIPGDFSFTGMDISEDTGDVTSRASVSGAIRVHTDTGRILLESMTAGSLDLETDTGDVTALEVTCGGNISVTVSTGKTRLTSVTCQSLTTKGSTGDVTLERVVGAEGFSIERSTGDVVFDRCDAAEITVSTSTGDVSGSLLTDKVFAVDTNTGHKEVPSTVTGGRCRITTDTGDIRITVAGSGQSGR